jgi:hypothetical protein
MCQALLGHTYMSHDKKKITTTTPNHTHSPPTNKALWLGTLKALD